MSRGSGIGVDNIHRRTKNMSFGVNNIARKVLKAYIGVNGVARLFFSPDWFIPTGLTAANVIAAYQFINASSESEALRDLGPAGKNLIKRGAPVWNRSYGFDFPDDGWAEGANFNLHQLDNESIAHFHTGIIRFTEMERVTDWNDYRGNDTTLSCIGLRYGLTYIRLDNYGDEYPKYLEGRAKTNTPCPNSGVIAWSPPDWKVRINGNVIPNANGEEAQTIWHNARRALLGQGCNWGSVAGRRYYFKGFKIQAAAFYNVALTDAQHAEMIARMNAL